jgi:hypothetical protein
MSQELTGCWNQLRKPELKLCTGTMYQVTKEGCVTDERKPRVTINQINGVMDAAGTPTNYDGCVDAERKPYWTNLPNCPDPLPPCHCCDGGYGPRSISLSIGGLTDPVPAICVPNCLSREGIAEAISLVNGSHTLQGISGYWQTGWGYPTCSWHGLVHGEICKDILLMVIMEPVRTNGVGPTLWIMAQWKCYQWGDSHFFYANTPRPCPGPCFSPSDGVSLPLSYTLPNNAGWGCAGGGGGGKFGGSATVTFPAYPA